jgi:hypothetical protein
VVLAPFFFLGIGAYYHADFQLTVMHEQGQLDGGKLQRRMEEFLYKNGGRFNFQIDLALQLIEYRSDWTGRAI